MDIIGPLGNARMARFRLSRDQYELLVILYLQATAPHPDDPPYRPKTHSRAESAAVSRMLRRLEERGLVGRIAEGPAQYRTTGAVLTDLGRRIMETT
jgi:DNA-binding MarR family transcriptional regulator